MQSTKIISTVAHDTKENWNRKKSFIPLQGEIIVYTNQTHVINSEGKEILIPGIKIGDGNAYLIDLPFINNSAQIPEGYNDIVEALNAHLANSGIHVTPEEKTFWNSKINCDVNGETLVINRL